MQFDHNTFCSDQQCTLVVASIDLCRKHFFLKSSSFSNWFCSALTVIVLCRLRAVSRNDHMFLIVTIVLLFDATAAIISNQTSVCRSTSLQYFGL